VPQEYRRTVNRDAPKFASSCATSGAPRVFVARPAWKLDAVTPQNVDVSVTIWSGWRCRSRKYTNHTIRVLMIKIAAAGLPCLSIMNMPPLPYLKRIPALAGMNWRGLYQCAGVGTVQPGLVTLCSPDPQAFRPRRRRRCASMSA